MSDPGRAAAAARRYLASRKNIAGMAGALAGVGLHIAGVVADLWPVVAVGLYGVGALVGPADPAPTAARLTDALRADAADLLDRVALRRKDLPSGAPEAVRGLLDVLRVVLDRLDQVADRPADRTAAPERLAVAAEIIRVDLPTCLDTYLGRTRVASPQRAAAELAIQLDVIAAATDRLAASVPDIDVRRAEDLTEELRRRHGDPS